MFIFTGDRDNKATIKSLLIDCSHKEKGSFRWWRRNRYESIVSPDPRDYRPGIQLLICLQLSCYKYQIILTVILSCDKVKLEGK